MSEPLLRVSQSLLSAWEWSFKKEDGWEDFLAALNKKTIPPNKAMLEGQRFENVLNASLNGEEIPKEHEWYKPVRQMTKYLWGAQQQVELYRETRVDGQRILLHGILDYLRAGIIYDCKYSENYKKHNGITKYLNNPQHPLYLALVPEAREFQYIICDGTYVYRECYPRDIVEPIEPTIKHFLTFLKANGLYDTYKKIWRMND